jgi:dTDP-4-dehydrorhamnose 3,5-epimerase
MKIINTKIKGLKVINTERFIDSRGEFRELLRKNISGAKKEFKFTCYSKSKKNVLRGLHLQVSHSQAKYITVVKGAILDVAVDLRKNSKTYKKHYKIILSSKNCKSIFIPEGFAHGFLSLEKENIIVYHLTEYRSKKDEVGIKWNEEKLRINWGIKKPILSLKDANENMSIFDYEKKYN